MDKEEGFTVWGDVTVVCSGLQKIPFYDIPSKTLLIFAQLTLLHHFSPAKNLMDTFVFALPTVHHPTTISFTETLAAGAGSAFYFMPVLNKICKMSAEAIDMDDRNVATACCWQDYSNDVSIPSLCRFEYHNLFISLVCIIIHCCSLEKAQPLPKENDDMATAWRNEGIKSSRFASLMISMNLIGINKGRPLVFLSIPCLQSNCSLTDRAGIMQLLLIWMNCFPHPSWFINEHSFPPPELMDYKGSFCLRVPTKAHHWGGEHNLCPLWLINTICGTLSILHLR